MEPAKIVARYADGRVVKGHTRDFSPEGCRFHLVPAPAERARAPVEVSLADLKALFFVRDFAGNPTYRERKEFGHAARPLGRPVEVLFGDGEVLVGYTMGYDPRRPGFFLFPVDPDSNNLRVFAVSTAVRQVLLPTDRRDNGPAVRPTAGGQGMVDPKLIGDIQTVVNVLRQTVSDWETLVRSVEALTRDHAQLRARCDELERECHELRAVHERLRQEHEEALRTATQLRSAHEALTADHEKSTHALRDIREQHEAALRDRQSAAHELATILRRLQG